MQLVMYEVAGQPRLGAMRGDQIIDLAAASAAAGADSQAVTSAPGGGPANGASTTLARGPVVLRSLRLLIAGGEHAFDEAHRALEFALDNDDPAWVHNLADVRLRAPLADARKVLLLAGNYAAHIEELGGVPVFPGQSMPQVFMKPPTTLIGPDEPIRLPGHLCEMVDYEGELAVIIGRRCRLVSPDEAMLCIAGYTNFNDVSGRELNTGMGRDPGGRAAFFDWLSGKWFDTFGPIGPALVTPDEIFNPQALDLVTRVNGEVRQEASTGEMLFSVGEAISWISEFMTLEPGDIIATGTPGGVGSPLGLYLKPGDVVEVEISGLGVLRNPVVAADGTF